jgi:hypothetical protein
MQKVVNWIVQDLKVIVQHIIVDRLDCMEWFMRAWHGASKRFQKVVQSHFTHIRIYEEYQNTKLWQTQKTKTTNHQHHPQHQ